MHSRFIALLGLTLTVAASAQTTPTVPPARAAAAPAQDPAVAAMAAKLQDWAQLGRYKAANDALPASEPGRVVFYGDSITDAWTRNGGTFFPGKPYVNRGISGQT